MPPRAWRFRVQDILDAIAQIRDYTAGMDFEEFSSSRIVIDATLYRISVIGEAASGIPEDVREQHPAIPWRPIRGMRNRLVHDYFGVRVETVWQTVCEDLSELTRQLEPLLDVGEE